MAKYIDAEAAMRVIRDLSLHGAVTATPQQLEAAIDEIPAADVEPVRHGRWKLEPTNPYDNPGYKNRMIKRCSCCGWQNACRHNYCPNCGAKMDGEVTE